MSYLMFLPHSYVETGKPTALFIFLHGTSHQGSDLHGILNEGPANFMERNPQLKDEFPMVCLFPQCPAHLRWDTPGMAQATVALIEQVSKAYRIDRDRVYLTGLSMGGEGTWLVAEADPDRFAAIALISAIAVEPDKAIREFTHLAIWIICGSEDGDFTAGSKKMDAAAEKGGDHASADGCAQRGTWVLEQFLSRPAFLSVIDAVPAEEPAGTIKNMKSSAHKTVYVLCAMAVVAGVAGAIPYVHLYRVGRADREAVAELRRIEDASSTRSMTAGRHGSDGFWATGRLIGPTVCILRGRR